MKKLVYLLILFSFVKCGSSKNATTGSAAVTGSKTYYALQVYHLTSNDQIALVDDYLKTAWLPALHRNGIKNVGVFKPVTNDTASDKKVLVFAPYNSLQQYEQLQTRMQQDVSLEQASPAFVNAPYNSPAFARYETILMQAFDRMPAMELPKLTSDRAQRIYELRSYEGATDALYKNKVQMFNEGGEVALFKRLNFNAVFYAAVLAGARMPNLMYLTTFENMAERDAHWKAFSDDAEWKTLSAKPEYQHNVSKADIYLMTPTAYSDF